MTLFKFILPLLLLEGVFAQTLSPKVQKLSQSKQWYRLLHVKKGIFTDSGEADGKGFYLAKGGEEDPFLELSENLKVLSKKTPITDSHYICKFPARFLWLKKSFDVPYKKSDLKKCAQLQEYKQRMDVEKVSIVFSSYYLESPASAFGHTLLRFHRQSGTTDSKKSKLLDMGINYSAQVTTENALLYALFGLVGLFEGHYSAVPYFYKVREYSDFESRDLWTYDLNLSGEQLERLVNHLWEVGNTFFYYYYFTENCNYNLLKLLEVAHFELNLTEELPTLFTIPGHTIQILKREPGLVSKVSMDASLKKRFEAYLDKLNPNEKSILFDVYDKRNMTRLGEIDSKRQHLFLDTLIEYIDFKHSREILLNQGEISKWKKEILIKRSEYDSFEAPKIVTNEREAPHKGHGPSRIGFGGGDKRQLFSYRLSYHDYLDFPDGMPPLATIEFFDMELFLENDAYILNKF